MASSVHAVSSVNILQSLTSRCLLTDDSCSSLLPSMTRMSVASRLAALESNFTAIVPVLSTAGLHFLFVASSNVSLSNRFVSLPGSTHVARFGRLVYVGKQTRRDEAGSTTNGQTTTVAEFVMANDFRTRPTNDTGEVIRRSRLMATVGRLHQLFVDDSYVYTVSDVAVYVHQAGVPAAIDSQSASVSRSLPSLEGGRLVRLLVAGMPFLLSVRPTAVSLQSVVRSGMRVVCDRQSAQTGLFEYELNVTTVDCPDKKAD